MKLLFNATEQKLTRLDDSVIVADSKNYLRAKFQFSTEEWQGTKTAIFKKGDVIKKQILDENGECDVPWEVIKSSCFTVSVFAGDLITTGEVVVRVKTSGYTEDGEYTMEPTPDVYTQIIKMIDELKAGGANEESINAAVAKYMEENPVQTMTEEEVTNIVENAGFAKSTDIPSVEGLASTEYVDNKVTNAGYVKSDELGTELSAYLTEHGITGGNTGTETSKSGAVGFYDTSAFIGDTFMVIPTSEAFVSSGNFLKFIGALNGSTGATYDLVEGEAVNVLGVDITLNEDGSVTLDGTPTATFYIATNISDDFRTAIIGQTVKVSYTKSDTTSLAFNTGLAFNDATYAYNLTQTGAYSGLVTAEMMSGATKFTVTSGIVFDNLTISAMLEIQNDKGYLSEYTKSDCEVITASTEYAIADYTVVGIVGEHTITYKTEGGSESLNTEEIEKLKVSNPLYGKKVVCLGDSLCYGQGFTGGYCTILSELEPNTTFINKGVGGSMISSNHASGGNWHIENQLSGVAEDTDYIVCEGYVNDYLTDCELGAITDGYEAELDTTTFYGGMESLCKTLANSYTDKRYGFIIAHSHYSADSAYDNVLYIEAIKECCNKWGVPYLDLSAIITPIVPIYKSTYYTDGLHYNEAGYRKITPAIREWVKTL